MREWLRAATNGSKVLQSLIALNHSIIFLIRNKFTIDLAIFENWYDEQRGSTIVAIKNIQLSSIKLKMVIGSIASAGSNPKTRE
jgi:hypothetical protein